MKNILLFVSFLALVSMATIPFATFADTGMSFSGIASLLKSLQVMVQSLTEQVREYTSTQPARVIDITGDGIVGSDDWNYMESRWFSNDITADINGDGIVNSIDFGILNRGWNANSR